MVALGVRGAVYINKRFFSQNPSRLEGWWGNAIDNRFEMLPDFTPAKGALAWHLSTPTVLALAPLRASLNIFSRIGMEALAHKSERLSTFLIDQLKSIERSDFEILTPEEADQRGTMVSLKFKRAGHDTFKHLEAEGVVVDWRRPNVIRVAPMPLYNDYQDINRFVAVLKATGSHLL